MEREYTITVYKNGVAQYEAKGLNASEVYNESLRYSMKFTHSKGDKPLEVGEERSLEMVIKRTI